MNHKDGTIPDAFKGWCDVREVSEAHVKAVEQTDAEGRYLIYSTDAHYAEVVRLMRVHPGLFDQPDVPINSPDGVMTGNPTKFDNSRARKLGVTFIDFEKTITDRLVRGQCAVSVRSVCGQRAVSAWSVCGQRAVSAWSACGKCAVSAWSVCGQCAVSVRSVCGQRSGSVREVYG